MYACGADRTQVLVCDARRWRVGGKCAGAKHCAETSTKIICDDTLGEPGMPCAEEGNTACAFDGASLLTCTKGVMGETSRCRGAQACVVRADVATCDRTVARAGDRCDADGEFACTEDHEAVVECHDHVMVQRSVCHCRVTGRELQCN